MKTMNSSALLEDLQTEVRKLLVHAGQLSQYPISLLETQPISGGWSMAQVLEHLNIYCRYYIPAIEARLHMHQTQPANSFRPGWLGNYFTTLMQPGENQTIKHKMKTPKSATPSAQPNASLMLDEFTAHQHQLLQVLQVAQTANLESIRIPITISKWIRIQLGDTFRFFIAHQQRHFVQISNILSSLKTTQ
jgi:uncharacterized damage-inducible protein DinB